MKKKNKNKLFSKFKNILTNKKNQFKKKLKKEKEKDKNSTEDIYPLW
tara:strand:+ start:101 stop:241 length:141 start_codon:yes stop_codon:yes gene_type:complete